MPTECVTDLISKPGCNADSNDHYIDVDDIRVSCRDKASGVLVGMMDALQQGRGDAPGSKPAAKKR